MAQKEKELEKTDKEKDLVKLAAKQKAVAKHEPKRLMQDVCRRWNSSYYMLERLLELLQPLTPILVDPVLTPKKDYRDLLLKERQWALAW